MVIVGAIDVAAGPARRRARDAQPGGRRLADRRPARDPGDARFLRRARHSPRGRDHPPGRDQQRLGADAQRRRALSLRDRHGRRSASLHERSGSSGSARAFGPASARTSWPSCTGAPTKSRTLSGSTRRGGSTGRASDAGGRLVVRRSGFRHPLVRRRRAQPVGQLPRPACVGARRPHCVDLRAGRAGHRPQPHLPRAARRNLPDGELAQAARHRARRPGDDLFADDPGSRGGDARLRPDRGDPLGGVRRLLARQPRRPDRRLRRLRGDHRRRGRARRQDHPAQGQCRQGARPAATCRR